MKANTQWNIGKAGSGFTVNLECEIPEAEVPAIVGEGLVRLGQRETDIDLVLGGVTLDAKGKRQRTQVAGDDGKPRNWQRGDVTFDAAVAKKLEELFSTLYFTDSSKDKPHTLTAVAVVGPYEGDGKSAPKFVREKAKMAEKESSEEGLEVFMKRFAGYEGETHTEDGENYAPAALASLKVAIDKFLSEKMKGM